MITIMKLISDCQEECDRDLVYNISLYRNMSVQNYEILNKLGEGSFGVVYKVRDKTTNTLQVIKKIDLSKMSAKLRRNAMEEGKILKQLNSPYIVKHYQTYVQKSTLNIVMEYCPKGDLAAFLKGQMGKPLKEDRIWKISIQMMVGLRDLHARKILHRDMKALNIFLDSDGNVRIGDLGVAKQMKSDFAHTIVGTPYYLSPEMCEEKPYNEKTDIWAMGCIIYELCTGKHPFEANNQAALALKIVMGKYNDIPKHYSSELEWVVRSCLSVDYKRRPTAAHLLTKPNIIQKAEKLGVILNSTRQRKGEIKQEKMQQNEKKQKPTHLVQSEKKNVVQTPNLEKKSTSGADSRKSAGRKISSVEKKQKQKLIPHYPKQIPKPKIPLKKDKIPISIDLNKAKKYSGAKIQEFKQQRSHSKNNSGLQVPSNFEKVQKIQKKEERYSSVKINTPQKANLAATMNRFLPDDFRKKKEFDVQDELNRHGKVEIPDSDSDSDDEGPKKQAEVKKDNQIFMNAQQSVNDDELMQQFGISPAKKDSLLQSEYKLQNKVKQINWNIEDNESKVKQELENQIPLENESSGIKQPNLPTIKTPSYLERQPLREMAMEEQDEQQNLLEEQLDIPQEQIEENQPYISDDQQEPIKEQGVLNNPNTPMKNNSRYGIEDYPQKRQKMQKKLEENHKRQNQLQRMKDHLQKQLLVIVPNKQQYEKIKIQLIDSSGDDEAVEKFVNKWKGNIQSINLFYRIIHFQVELRRCLQNIQLIQNNLSEIQNNIN